MKKLAVLALVLVMVGMASAQEEVKIYTNYPDLSKLEPSEEGKFLTYNATTEQPSWVSSTSTFMVQATIQPLSVIVFGDPEVGRITWESGEIRFEGNFDESARMFFEYFWKNYALEGCQ
jgi:hypothetical protein